MRFFNFKKRRNSGYTERNDGTKLSLRASYAEEEGKFTAGRFRTEYGVSKNDFDALVMVGVIVTKEWHHTGKSYTKNDFYEWEDDDFYEIYTQSKHEISVLSKQIKGADWQYKSKEYIIPVEPFESFKNDAFESDYTLFLTDEEINRMKQMHDEISQSAKKFPYSYQRYLMHKNVDDAFRNKAEQRMDEEHYRKAYEKEWGESIALNAERSKANEDIKAFNLATTGKEALLTRIAGIFYEDDMYDTVCKVSETIQMQVRVDAACKIRKAEEAERQRVYKEKKSLADKKQHDYLQKCIKAGKAEEFNRMTEIDDLCFVQMKEMNGKYGWFEANSKYNLTVYYTGYKFANKRSINHYIKLGQIK